MSVWQQSGLFETMYGGTAPYQRHSDTSMGAAVSMTESRRATLRALVLRHLVAAGAAGAIDEEMQDALHMEGNTQRPRRRELEQAGLVIDSGRRRPTTKGKRATVWVVSHVA